MLQSIAEQRDNQTVPVVVVNRQQIEEGVQRAAQALAQTVVRIRYEYGDDHTGDPSIFFNVLLTDEAASRPRLGQLAETVISEVRRAVKPDEQGLNAYFNFRSLAE